MFIADNSIEWLILSRTAFSPCEWASTDGMIRWACIWLCSDWSFGEIHNGRYDMLSRFSQVIIRHKITTNALHDVIAMVMDCFFYVDESSIETPLGRTLTYMLKPTCQPS